MSVVSPLQAGVLVCASVLLGGCATQYSLSAKINSPDRPDMRCAVQALRALRVDVTHSAPDHLVVSSRGIAADLYVHNHGFEMIRLSQWSAPHCEDIEKTAPFFEQTLGAIQKACMPSADSGISETWDEENCVPEKPIPEDEPAAPAPENTKPAPDVPKPDEPAKPGDAASPAAPTAAPAADAQFK